jgi:hypothetical protein
MLLVIVAGTDPVDDEEALWALRGVRTPCQMPRL